MNTNETDRPFYPIDDPEHPAPRDGTWVEGHNPKWGMPKPHPEIRWTPGGWITRDGYTYSNRVPTHWRPIAPTPAPATSEGQTPPSYPNEPIGLGIKMTYDQAKRYEAEQALIAATRRAEEAERECARLAEQRDQFQKDNEELRGKGFTIRRTHIETH